MLYMPNKYETLIIWLLHIILYRLVNHRELKVLIMP